jgi:hypothetical protein
MCAVFVLAYILRQFICYAAPEIAIDNLHDAY